MKILHTSDIHIGRNLSAYSLIEDQAYFLNQLKQIITSNKIDVLMISGDVYNSAVPSAAAVRVLDVFLTDVVLNKKVTVLMIAGNHDSPERLQFSNKILEKAGLFISSDLKDGVKQITFKNDEIGITLLPYFDPGTVKEKLSEGDISTYNDAAKVICDKYLKSKLCCRINILMAHGFFIDPKGKKAVLCESELNVGGSDAVDINLFEGFDYLALGHLHSYQKAGANGYYCGSPLKYSLSEVNNNKSLCMVDIDDNFNLSVSQIPIRPLRDLRVVEGYYNDIIKNPSDDYVFIRLLDDRFIINGMGNLKPYFPNCVDLQYLNIKYANQSNVNLNKQRTPCEIFSIFFESMTGNKMTVKEEELLNKVIKEAGNETD